MADFILDTRPESRKTVLRIGKLIKFSDRLHLEYIKKAEFSLILAWFGEPSLWRPYKATDGSIYAVIGMLALDESEWGDIDREEGNGGLAAKAIARRFKSGGSAALEKINGNCAIIIYDAIKRKLYLRTDPAGVFPVYLCESNGMPVWGSHPDMLATITGENGHLDEVSLAEFILTSTVTPPFTYYKRIHAVDPGMLVMFDYNEKRQSKYRYFNFTFQGDSKISEDELAEQLASAWKKAVQRRTIPLLGKPVVALSGGLDSRLILASMSKPENAIAFTCYDVPNHEFNIARDVAEKMGVKFLPIQRSTDYYGENAEAGVRISGGMGTFANNHFLGVLENLHGEGMQIMLTGCYCDYLFKALPLNRHIHWLTGRESLAPFAYQFYFDHWMTGTPLAKQAFNRWENRFPPGLQNSHDDAKLFELEVRRTFPLCYEGDNQQRLVPQRLTGWFPPLIDIDLLRIYCQIPPSIKLNRRIFLKMASRILANSPVAQIPDANTGINFNAHPIKTILFYNWLRLRRRLRGIGHSLASEGSWPDWYYYYTHSPTLEELWRRPHKESEEFFLKVLGWRQLPKRTVDFPPKHVFLFVALLTQKIWWQSFQ